MMNIQRLVSIGCFGFLMILAVMSGLAVGNSPAADSNHPLPVRAPMPIQATAQTAPAVPSGTTAATSQPQPQPQPVPIPPTAAAATIAPTQADSGPVSLLLLVVTVIGVFIGLTVLGQRWQRANGRFPHPSILASGAQS